MPIKDIRGWSEFWCVIDWTQQATCELVLEGPGAQPVAVLLRSDAPELTFTEGTHPAATVAHRPLGRKTHVGFRLDGPSDGKARGLTIELDSAPLLTLLAGRQSGFEGYTEVLLDGAVDAATFGMWHASAAPVLPAIRVGDDLQICGFIMSKGRPSICFALEGDDPVPLALSCFDPCAAQPCASTQQWRMEAPLPGWIWCDPGPVEGAALLSFTDAGKPIGTLAVSREQVLAKIERIAAGAPPGTDAVIELSVLEHVVHGGFLPSLSALAQHYAARVAELYGLDDFFQPACLGHRQAARPAAPRRSLDGELMGKAVGAAASLLRPADVNVSAGLEAVARDHGLRGGDVRMRDFLLQLVEGFVLAGRFDELAAFARAALRMAPPPPSEGWMRSASLPFLVAQGDLAQAAEAIWSLDPARGWLVTPAIGQAVTAAWRLTVESAADAELVRSIAYGYMSLVRKMRSDYWGRAQCSALIACSAGLLHGASRSPEFLHRDLERFALEVHGLSSEFWEHVRALKLTGTQLRAGERHFARLRALAERPDAVPADEAMNAVRYFTEYSPAEALRFARELLAPNVLERLVTGEAPGLLRGPGARSGEAMRTAAHPLFEGSALGLGAELRQALTECKDEAEHSSSAQLRTEAIRALHAFASDPLRTAAPLPGEPALAEYVSSLILAGDPVKAVELATLCAVILLQRGEADHALRALTQARRVVESQSGSLEHLGQHPGLLAALLRLDAADARGRGYASFLLGREARLPLPPAVPAAARGPAAPIGAARPPSDVIFDCLVTIVSCRKYLAARRPVIERTYGGRLRALGIPYVFVVGGEAEGLEGDTLTVRCPDDYEHLPDKTLAIIEWVHRRTPYGYMLKIDDDCFLNVDEFFLEHGYRSANYQGRKISRAVGAMDRVWHAQKSSTRRARLTLDKSPEPSVYADGGSGYALSRTAMEAVLEGVLTPKGAALKNSSFMEDKLVGDLLRLSDIAVEAVDYTVSVFRKPAGGDQPVSMFANAFLPSAVWPAKLAHLDDARLFDRAERQLARETLRPAKVWPSFAAPRIGWNTNALDLVTDEDKAIPLLKADTAVIACVRNEITLLPQFLAHYRQLGVESFLISDNCSTDGSLAYLLGQPDVAAFSCDTEYRESNYGVAWQQALLSSFRCGLWSVVADADEFLVCPGPAGRPLASLLHEADAAGANAVMALMVDMYPRGDLAACDLSQGDVFQLAPFTDRDPLRPAWFNGPYSNAAAWTSSVRHRLIENAGPSDFTSQKTCILKYAPWMQLSAGMHYVGDCRTFDRPAILCHFKYHAGFHAKVSEEVRRRQHYQNGAEYRKYHEAIGAGSLTLHDAAWSVPWRDATMVREALDGRLRLPWPVTRAAV